jgi:DNA-directed RNA polymerase specialized sigma24 family protein/LysM repeat protein
MKPQEYEFSPDLAWMLISGQVSDEILLEALFQEFFRDIYRLCLAALDDHRLALRAADSIFASAIVNRYRFKENLSVRDWFMQLSLETLIQFYTSLNRKRTITANLPFKKEANLLGDSTPDSFWDAEIWLTLDQLDFDKRLLALLLYFLQWQDTEIAAIFNFSQEELNHNKRYLNSVLLPFRIEKRIDSAASLEENIIQSLSRRWPETSLPVIHSDQFIQQATNHIRILKLKNRLKVSSKEVFLTIIIISLAAVSIWGINYFSPEEAEPTPQAYEASANIAATQISTLSSQSPVPASEIPEDSRSSIQEVIYIVQPGDSLTSIARQYKLSFHALRQVNRIPGNSNIQAGQRLWFFTDDAHPDLNLENYLAQVDKDISYEEFNYLSLPLLRNLETIYPKGDLLWVEGQVIHYGPDGYIGPPKIEFVQAWLTPDAALYLIGNQQQEIQEVWLLTDQYQFMAAPGEELPWSHIWLPVNLKSPFLESLTLFSDALARRTKFSTIITKNSEEPLIWNGRTTSAYDIKDTESILLERHWIDDETGIMVRRRLFSPLNTSTITDEVYLTQIEDTKIEGSRNPLVGLLDPRIPWRGGFASNSQGTPAPIASEPIRLDQAPERVRLSPVANNQAKSEFDFSTTQLTFQYPQTLTQLNQFPVEIFANNQFIGSVEMGSPWIMICDRSKDGRFLAYVNQPGQAPSQSTRLQWIDLKEPETRLQMLPMDLGLKIFAFSPDGKYLSVFGFPGEFMTGRFMIIEIASGEVTLLDSLGDASSLVWSPDSQQIAIIARSRNSAFFEDMLVYDINSTKIIQRQMLNFTKNQKPDWPTKAWGVNFPVKMSGLSKCVTAPMEAP